MPDLKFLNAYDYFILGGYMLVVAGVGAYVARFNKQTSDYFKGGGRIPWILSMVSLFVSGFSAFMFVGAAGFTYKNGGAALILFSLAGPAYMFGYFIYGPLWKRTRIDTPMEFLERRYSPGTTYFYSLLALIPNVLILGIMVYTLCIFVSTALGFNERIFDIGFASVSGLQFTMLITGVVLVFYTLLGGLWAVMVTDALQFIILILITVILLPVAYLKLGDGNFVEGIRRLTTDAPDGFLGFGLKSQPPLFWVVYFVNIVLGYNVNYHIAQRYYCVPDERDTRKMALWCAGLSLLMPFLWVAPILASKVMFPDLAALWPTLTDPTEASFVTLALTTLPHGMLGIMVAAIFAATMSSADSAINWMAAVVTKDVYVPIKKRLGHVEPSDRNQMIVGRVSVAVMGIIAIWIAFNMDRFGGAFDTYLRANSLYSAPMFIPIMLGLVFRKTPWWSGMAAFGFGVLCVVLGGIIANRSLGLPAATFGDLFQDIRLTILGVEMTRYELNTLVGIAGASVAFFGSAAFFKRSRKYRETLAAFDVDLRTPAHDDGGPLDLRGFRAYRIAGVLAIALGSALLIIAFPAAAGEGTHLNIIAGTLGIVIGFALIRLTRKQLAGADEADETDETDG